MEYKPRGLAKLLGWILEILFPRHYALLNYVHVSRYERIDPAKLIGMDERGRHGRNKRS
jgi:hypothetical protein